MLKAEARYDRHNLLEQKIDCYNFFFSLPPQNGGYRGRCMNPDIFLIFFPAWGPLLLERFNILFSKSVTKDFQYVSFKLKITYIIKRIINQSLYYSLLLPLDHPFFFSTTTPKQIYSIRRLEHRLASTSGRSETENVGLSNTNINENSTSRKSKDSISKMLF